MLPSATEIVTSLGLGDQLVGVTHECDYPPFVLDLPKVTRTLVPHDATSSHIDALVRERLKTKSALYSLDMPTLTRLQPDLIVTQALCDVCAVAEDEVREAACTLPGSPRVINLEPTSWAAVLDSIRDVGRAAGCPTSADVVVGGPGSPRGGSGPANCPTCMSGPEWFCSNGSIHRSPAATGAPNWWPWPVAPSAWDGPDKLPAH